MTKQTAFKRLDTSEIEHLDEYNFHRVRCSCGHTLFVWPNRNVCSCHRARCYHCKQGPSYILDIKKWEYGRHVRLIVHEDTFEDARAALLRRACKIADTTYQETEDEKTN